MARLPSPGGDDGVWGDLLNEFLLTSHDEEGQLEASTVGGVQLQNGAVTGAKIADNAITYGKLATSLQAQITDGGREVELQTSATHVQWRYVGESTWVDLIELASLRGSQGEVGPPGLVVLEASDPDPATPINGVLYVRKVE